jgi:predicted metal-dependent HD superfamily phosphohydrolase
MDFIGARDYLLKRLNTELKPTLYYHNIEHALDVHQAACQLIELEGINGHAKTCIETAALFHDAGMIKQYANHEEASVIIVREVLPQFGYLPSSIDEISRLIMITKLPQNPMDLYEKIICDADLDYLGREDFLIHAFKLRVEWQINNIKTTTLREWFEIQVQFLGNHTYFTPSALLLRNEKKQSNLMEIKQFLIKNQL